MPLVSKTFSEIITFTRASTGTFTGINGLMQSAAINAPRFDYNPTTLAPLGFLVEEARNNSLLYSEQFDNAAWTKSNATVTSNATTAPNGSLAADKLVEDTANNTHLIQQTPTFTSGTVYSQSVYVKAGERSFVQLRTSSGSTFSASFDLTLGVASQQTAGTTASIVAAGNGWYRCSIVFTAGATGASACRIALLEDATTQSYTGNGTSGLFIWGAQLEAGAFPTSYIPTTPTFTSRATTGTFVDSSGLIATAAINVARNTYNPANLTAAPFLLLEAAAANLVTYSEQFDNAAWTKSNATVTSNATTAPNGSLAADKLVEDTANNTHLIQQTPTFTSGTVYSQSVYVKAGERSFVQLRTSSGSTFSASFDLTLGVASQQTAGTTASIVAAGNGWYRCSIVFTAGATGASACRIALLEDATTQSYTGNGTSGLFIWGAQLETGAFPTSYIPTTIAEVTRAEDVSTSAAVPRAADVASINTLSPWYNAAAGTLYGEFDSVASGTRTVAAINDGTSNESIQLRTISDNPFFTVTDGGVDQVDIDAGTVASYTRYKFAGAYNINDFAACIAGGTVQTDTSGTLPTVTQLFLGASASANYLNGHLQRITYYPRRLTNAELQTLTA